MVYRCIYLYSIVFLSFGCWRRDFTELGLILGRAPLSSPDEDALNLFVC